MSKQSKRREALVYHAKPTPGKIQVVPTKKYATQRDLSLAYSPGVAEPCLEIAKDVNNVYKYTAKGNLVAVISNGTAVLGLGNIGPEASKPVMEGKGLLFKIFADIDVFDIEINTENVEEFIQTVKNISPTFGGINLEDIKAPEAFEIEQRLKAELDIPETVHPKHPARSPEESRNTSPVQSLLLPPTPHLLRVRLERKNPHQMDQDTALEELLGYLDYRN